jgi:hypothetical protein
LKNGVFILDFHRNLRNDILNSGGSLNYDGSVDDFGDQGSANSRWRVDGNWCRILNWRLNSSPLRFRGRSLNRCGWSLDWDKIREHDLEHPLDSETDYLSPSSIQVDVTSGLENVLSNLSLCVQQ